MALLALVLLLLTLSHAQQEPIQQIGSGIIPADQQTYSWGPEHRCILLAHQSVILKNEDHHLLVFDGGMAKYKFTWQNQPVEVLDLNAWTVTIDLSKRFILKDFKPLSQHKKDPTVPVLHGFGAWTDSTQNNMYIQGGIFYTAPKWNESRYFIKDSAIPPYSVWRFDVTTETWTDVTEMGNSKSGFQRAARGAPASVPGLNQSFYVGGVGGPRSDVNAPKDLIIPQGGMLRYDHTHGTLYNETYGTDEDKGLAFWHGSLNFMQLGPGKGYLIPLMASQGPAGNPRPDAPGANDESGQSIVFDHVMMYNLDTEEWYKQKTTYIDNNLPITRTRFCGQTVYSNSTNTWELWVYGGQLVQEKPGEVEGTEEVDYIYVLSMPSYIWTKVTIPMGEAQTRSHTCHALGSQLLVLGGAPPEHHLVSASYTVIEESPCDGELLQVFDMNTVSWKNSYDPNTTYSAPYDVRVNTQIDSESRREPYLKPWADPALKVAFDYIPGNNTSGGARGRGRLAVWKIVLISIGAVFGTAVGFEILRMYCKSR